MTIDELKEKWERDPNSRIFLQLAEEYRKASRWGEAILVCQDGLKRHPGYTTARITLARALQGARRLEEAKKEYETVLAAVPDNLLANRLLADILYEEGRTQEALKRYRVVAMLSPTDEEVKSRIQRLEGGTAPAPAGARATAREVMRRFVPGAPAASGSVRPEAVDEGGFMDLKIDESVILNADMIAAALGQPPGREPETAGRPASVAPPVAPPPVAPPPRAVSPGGAPATLAAAPAPPAAGTSGAAAAAAGEVGEMGLDDFSEFSSPTVMLTAADLAKIPGVADAAAPPAPPAPVEVSAPAPSLARASKYGINLGVDSYAAPRSAGGEAKLAAAPPAAPAPPRVEISAAEDSGALDDFSEFAAPTVMMNVNDLLAAAGVAADGPASPVAGPAPVEVAAGELAAPAARADEEPAAEEQPMAAAAAEEDWLGAGEEAVPAAAFPEAEAGAALVEAIPGGPAAREPEERPVVPAYGTQMIPTAELEGLRARYSAALEATPEETPLAAGEPIGEEPPPFDLPAESEAPAATAAASPFEEPVDEPFAPAPLAAAHAEPAGVAMAATEAPAAPVESVAVAGPAPSAPAGVAGDERKKKMEKLSSWLRSLKKG